MTVTVWHPCDTAPKPPVGEGRPRGTRPSHRPQVDNRRRRCRIGAPLPVVALRATEGTDPSPTKYVACRATPIPVLGDGPDMTATTLAVPTNGRVPAGYTLEWMALRSRLLNYLPGIFTEGKSRRF